MEGKEKVKGLINGNQGKSSMNTDDAGFFFVKNNLYMCSYSNNGIIILMAVHTIFWYFIQTEYSEITCRVISMEIQP